jgi:hypothetical protein
MMRKAAIVFAIATGVGFTAFAAGTALSIVFGSPWVECPDGNVTVDYTISTTAGDGATVTEKLTDSSNSTIGTPNTYTISSGNVPGGWTFAGRTKTHDGVFKANGLSDGDYSLQVCVIQAGSIGNTAKTICESKTIHVACAEQVLNPCASTAPFGEVVGNKHIGDHATAEIQFEGNFGQSALVEITDSEGAFVGSAYISRAGGSCNYHANWKFTTDDGADIYGNHGPGLYTIKVTGSNNASLEFPVVLN